MTDTIIDSVTLATTVTASVVNPAVLQAPPYNMSSGTNGLINVAGISKP